VNRFGKLHLLGGLALLLLTAWQAAPLVTLWLNENQFAGDAAQHVWWMWRYRDPSLFPDDLAATYYSQPTFSTPAYRLIYQLLAPYIDPQTISESIALLLVPVTIGAAFLLGKSLAGSRVALAWLLPILLVAGEGLDLLKGGFPRSFALPLLLLAMDAMVRRRLIALSVVVLCAALLYPPMVLNIVGCAGVLLMIHLIRKRSVEVRSIGPVLAVVASILIAFALIAYSQFQPTLPEIGNWYTLEEAKQMAEWNRGGRVAFFRPWHILYFHQAYAGVGLTLPVFALTLGAIVLTLRRNRIEPLALLASGLILFGLAHAMLFTLYLPSRYMLYVWPVFLPMSAVVLLRQVPWRLTPIVAGMAVSIAVGFARPWASPPVVFPAPIDDVHTTALYDFLRTLPKDAVLVAHPDDANGIPLRAQRSVLVNTETSPAFHKAYYGEMSRRLKAVLMAISSSNPEDVNRLRNEPGVRYVVVNTGRYAQSVMVSSYFAPFETVSAGPAHILTMTPVFRAGAWAVIDVQDPRRIP
jgi:hypothetical protein